MYMCVYVRKYLYVYVACAMYTHVSNFPQDLNERKYELLKWYYLLAYFIYKYTMADNKHNRCPFSQSSASLERYETDYDFSKLTIFKLIVLNKL